MNLVQRQLFILNYTFLENVGLQLFLRRLAPIFCKSRTIAFVQYNFLILY